LEVEEITFLNINLTLFHGKHDSYYIIQENIIDPQMIFILCIIPRYTWSLLH